MISDRLPDRAQLGSGGRKIAGEMAGDDRVGNIAKAIDDEDPGEKQMPLAGHCQPATIRNGQPRRKGTSDQIAVRTLGGAQQTSSDELVTEDPCDAGAHLCAGPRDGQSGAHPPGSAHKCIVAFEEAKLTFDLAGNPYSNAYANGSRAPARCAQPQRTLAAKVDSVESPIEVHRHRQ